MSVTADSDLLDALFDELFPICRSLMGPGFRQSLAILRRYMPLAVESVPSGTEVFDWTVPDEWQLRSARLIGPDGVVYADAARHNLHVVQYSEPVWGEYDLDELRPHLYSVPGLPDAIPYVTSYYQRRWGFCLPHRVLEVLPAGTYRVEIDSVLVPGQLDFAHCVLPGESEQEVLLTSYLCHPSMANNELSGPLVLLALYRRLAAWPRRRYTYRFLINPETIGALCFLWRHGEHLQRHMAGGLVLSCLGGPKPRLAYKCSRNEQSLLDRFFRHLHDEGEPIDLVPFSPIAGSDERQYCSPGFNLPMGLMRRTLDGDYAAYHTSADDKAFMGIEPLVAAADHLESLLKRFETASCYRNRCPYGEPQLGKRDLYPTINTPDRDAGTSLEAVDQLAFRHRVLQVLSDADGYRPVIESARALGCRIDDLVPVVERLESVGLLTFEGTGLAAGRQPGRGGAEAPCR